MKPPETLSPPFKLSLSTHLLLLSAARLHDGFVESEKLLAFEGGASQNVFDTSQFTGLDSVQRTKWASKHFSDNLILILTKTDVVTDHAYRGGYK